MFVGLLTLDWLMAILLVVVLPAVSANGDLLLIVDPDHNDLDVDILESVHLAPDSAVASLSRGTWSWRRTCGR